MLANLTCRTALHLNAPKPLKIADVLLDAAEAHAIQQQNGVRRINLRVANMRPLNEA